MEHILNYIDGKLIEPAGGQYFDNIEPATGHVYGKIPDSDHQDISQAYQSSI